MMKWRLSFVNPDTVLLSSKCLVTDYINLLLCVSVLSDMEHSFIRLLHTLYIHQSRFDSHPEKLKLASKF